MNWEMIAAVGQLAAVFVGIPSLIYLAVQIREQTKERRQAAVHALTEQWGALTESLHNNPEMAAIFLRGADSFNDLDSISKLRFSAFFNRLLNIFEGMYFSHAQRILTGSSWRAIERTMTDLIAYPGVQQWWEVRKHWHTEEFDQLVREIIAKGKKPTAFSAFNLSEVSLPGEKVTCDK
ncbi:MAG TPA: hypothetical protein VKS98_01875 [Chthoniobacterales bacterium]|nr:hypothetical protein [Chthoniobacterales bacterium]